jgi:hypothetical protein
MQLTITAFRKNIYQLIDWVIATGEPIILKRKGKTIKIVIEDTIEEPKPKIINDLSKLTPHPDAITEDPEYYVSIDWSKEWNPDFP